MAIRPALPQDLPAIERLNEAGYARRHTLEPDVFAPTPRKASTTPRWGRRSAGEESFELVAAIPSTIRTGTASAGDAPDHRGREVVGHLSALALATNGQPPLWHVEHLDALRVRPHPPVVDDGDPTGADRGPPPRRPAPSNDSIERTLLAAAASTAYARGGRTLLVGAAATDQARSVTLQRAGFTIDSWFRHLRLAGPNPIRASTPEGTEPGLPLPHLHEFVAELTTATSVSTTGGRALVSRSLAAGGLLRPTGRFRVVDPAIANDAASMMELIAAVEDVARDSGDHLLLVAVGPAEEQLDHVLAARGYARSVNWWTLRARN